MKEIKTVSIIGLGALGILFGQHLSKHLSPKTLRFLADEKRIARYQKELIYCNGQRCDFRFVTPEAEIEPADLLLFTVKFNGLSQAIQSVKNHVGEETIILSALNGISSEAMIGEAYGMDKLLYCVAQGMDGIKEGNSLNYQHMGMLCFGEEEAGVISDKTKAVDEFFNRVGLPHEVETDMMKRMWGKLLLNVGVNQTAAVYLCSYGGLQQEGEARDTMIAAMREVIPLSERAGYPLTEADLSYWLGVLASLNPDGKPSMQQDMESGLATEVELFAGTVIQRSKHYGLTAPVNEMLYQRVKEMEAGF